MRVGLSGWRYSNWRGGFYPKGLAQRRELEHASRVFDTLEINGSFYSLQRPTTYRRWFEEAPDDFLFAVKGGRFITHMKRLRDVDEALANFFASGVLRLGHKLGPVLWQLPERVAFEPAVLAAFFDRLPRTTDEAAELAARHAPRFAGRVWTTADAPGMRIRHAIEVRHPSFFADGALPDVLRAHDVALVAADTAGCWGLAEDVTSDFAYVRLHGSRQLYYSAYTDDELADWARRIEAWSAGSEVPDARRLGPPAVPRPGGRDVFVYFDNTAVEHAPRDAVRLRERLGRSEVRCASTT